jgi:hypothetical protein
VRDDGSHWTQGFPPHVLRDYALIADNGESGNGGEHDRPGEQDCPHELDRPREQRRPGHRRGSTRVLRRRPAASSRSADPGVHRVPG